MPAISEPSSGPNLTNDAGSKHIVLKKACDTDSLERGQPSEIPILGKTQSSAIETRVNPSRLQVVQNSVPVGPQDIWAGLKVFCSCYRSGIDRNNQNVESSDGFVSIVGGMRIVAAILTLDNRQKCA